MKKLISLTALLFAAGTLLAADATPQTDVTAAAKKLAAADNYSWKTTVEMVNGGRFQPGTTEGKTTHDGTTQITITRAENVSSGFLKNGLGALKTDDGWHSLKHILKDNSDGFNPARFFALMLSNFKAPATEAETLAANSTNLQLADGVYSGDLTEAGASEKLTFRPATENNPGPTVTGAKGNVKFWLKDGVLTKYQFHVEGKVEFNGNGRDVNRTTTIEIKDVGATKIEIPEEAEKMLG